MSQFAKLVISFSFYKIIIITLQSNLSKEHK